MNRFLQLVAKDLYERFRDELSGCCIVFPSRRAHLHFNYYLAALIKKPIWTPEYTTINEFFTGLSALRPADNLRLNYTLYEEYRKIKKSEEHFNQFYYWGNMLLGDFDDIDKYLVDPGQLFTNLKELKDIERDLSYLSEEQLNAIRQYWNVFNAEKLNTHQEFFIGIWEVLAEVYLALKNKLLLQNLGYSGMICRDVIEKIKNGSAPEFSKKAYVFVGFNALNRCEEELFQHIHNQGKALFYWDYDSYYVNNPHHEAGLFIRNNIKRFPSALKNAEYDNFITSKKTIEIFAVPSQTGQAKMISHFLKEKGGMNEKAWDHTAIVLADEQMLLPVLYAIPDEVTDINVTMGYPVRLSGFAGLLSLIMELCRRTTKPESEKIRFYHKYVSSILNHQMIRLSFTDDCISVLSSITKENKIYLQQEELSGNAVFKHIFSIPATSNQMMEYLLQLCKLIVSCGSAGEEQKRISDIEKENIFVLFTELTKLKDILEKIPEQLSYDLTIKIITQVVNSLTIPFEGEPLNGLQVMGLLETRTLDFDNVIVLSVNEGAVPKAVPPLSFVPYNLRKGFGLPTIENQDAIFAYYFYRLLQRAKNVKLVYNSTNNKGLQSQEMSRYLLQLKYEADLPIQQHTQTFEIKPCEKNIISIPKTSDTVSLLNEYLEGGKRQLSPSALSKYIDCPLRFYFSYIAHIEEPDELQEEVDDMIFGNVLHHSMEAIYRPFTGKIVDKNTLGKISKDKDSIDKLVSRTLQGMFSKSSFKGDEKLSGKNAIVHNMISEYVRKIIEQDICIAPFTIISLEKQLSFLFPFVKGAENLKLQMKGTIDRIDEMNDGTVRIVDYKTGSIKDSVSDLNILFDGNEKKRSDHVMQILCYSMMYKPIAENKRIIPALYYVRKLFGDFNWKIKIDKKEVNDAGVYDQPFREHLSNTVLSLFDSTVPFVQTDDVKKCEFCSYRAVCMR